MIDPEDRMLDLALEELYGSREQAPERLREAMNRFERRLSDLEAPARRRPLAGRRTAAVAASLLSLSLASWFVLSRFGPVDSMSSRDGDRTSRGIRPEGRQASPPEGRIQAVEVGRNGSALDPEIGQTVTIDLGTAQGVGPESWFEVVRESEVLGSLVIRKAEKTWAMGTYRARQPRGESARVGDAVRSLIPTGENVPSRQDEPTDRDVRQWIEQLSDPDAGVRDRASAALKARGTTILGLLREELGRARDPETRARLQDVIAYWTTGIAARVDNEIVKWDEVDRSFQGMRPSDITPDLRRQRLRSLVEELALLHEARRRGIVATEQELNELRRRKAAAVGGEEAYRADLWARGRTLEGEQEELRRQLILSKLHDGILEQARVNPGSDPFRLELKETSRDDLRRWYDANPEKFAGVDRLDVCWVELSFENDQQKAAKKALAEAILAKSHTKKNLGLACAEVGVRDNIHIAVFERDRASPGPLGEATKKLLFDSFAFGEVRAIEDGSTIFVLQLYDRTRRVIETFEEAEPVLRAMFENQRREANRKRMRDGILERASIWPPDLFKNP